MPNIEFGLEKCENGRVSHLMGFGIRDKWEVIWASWALRLHKDFQETFES